MNCNICELKYGPFCTTLPGGKGYAKTDPDCPLVKSGRTEVGNFMFCDKHRYKFGAGTLYGTLGWY